MLSWRTYVYENIPKQNEEFLNFELKSKF
jgi:hypothetical protein